MFFMKDNSKEKSKIYLIRNISEPVHGDIKYENNTIPIESLMDIIYNLFYENEGSPIKAVEIVEKLVDRKILEEEKVGRFSDRVMKRHVCKKYKISDTTYKRKCYFYPTALILRLEKDNTKKGNSPEEANENISKDSDIYIYDSTANSEFDANLEKIYEKVKVNICKNSVTLKDFLNLFHNEDPKIVLKNLIDITKIVNNINEPEYDTLESLKEEVSSKNGHFCNLTHPKNQIFVGRDFILNDIKNSLSSSNGKSVEIVVLSGLGGVGKSELAIEYAHEHSNDTESIWWLRAESRHNLEMDYLDLKEHFKIHFPKEMKNEERIKRIRLELEKQIDWLLIFDNALRIEDINDYLPKRKTGRVLVTSRNPNWQNVTKVIEVDVFYRSESIDYIIKFLLRDVRDKQVADKLAVEMVGDADKLAAELGDLPLALTQACAYIKSKSCSTISEYLELFKKYKVDLFKEKESKVDNYRNTIETTWLISIKAVEESCRDGVYLLTLCAFMAPEGIPIKLIEKGSDHLPWNGDILFSDGLKMNRAISSLIGYSLIQREKDMYQCIGLYNSLPGIT